MVTYEKEKLDVAKSAVGLGQSVLGWKQVILSGLKTSEVGSGQPIFSKWFFFFKSDVTYYSTLKKINMTTYFENLIVELHILYVFNTHVKFRDNWMLFIIQSINLFLFIILEYKNLKFKHLINNITIDRWSSRNFANMENIRRKCNPILNLSKFASNKIILSGVVTISCKFITKFVIKLWSNASIT